jgi:hypothetical protein
MTVREQRGKAGQPDELLLTLSRDRQDKNINVY